MPRLPRLCLALLLASPLIAAAPGAWADPPPSIPEGVSLPLEHYTLPNGLRVVLQEDHRTPRVAIEILFDAGVVDDPAGRFGMAALMEHALRYGAPRQLAPADTSDLFRALSIPPFWFEVKAADDYTGMKAQVDARALPVALWLASNQVGFFRDGIHQNLVEQAADNIAGWRGPTAEERLVKTVAENVFGAGHPCVHLFGAPAADKLAAVTPAEVRARAAQLYQVGNATLVLAGDLAPRAAKQLVERYFGSLAGRPRPEVAAPPQAGLKSVVRVSQEMPAGLGTVLLAWPTPRYFEEDDLALDVVAHILQARLARRLVDEQHLVAAASAQQISRRHGSLFLIRLKVADGRSLDAAARAAEQEIEGLRDAPPTEAELVAARDVYLLAALRRVEALEDRAYMLATFASHTGDPGHLDSVLASRRRIDGETVRRVVRTHLPLDRRVVALGPPSPRPTAGGI